MAITRYDGVAPAPGSLVTVRLHGVITLTTLYADALLTPLGNPFASDLLSGVYDFYADNANAYDVALSVVSQPSVRTPLAPTVIASGTSPARVVSLVVDDAGQSVVIAQAVY